MLLYFISEVVILRWFSPTMSLCPNTVVRVCMNVSPLIQWCICLLCFQLGQAVTKNPGYLKLRRIRAAQNIAKTVGGSVTDYVAVMFWLCGGFHDQSCVCSQVASSQNKVYLSADSLVLNLQDQTLFDRYVCKQLRMNPFTSLVSSSSNIKRATWPVTHTNTQ